jgi:hypothetical protein
VLSIKESIKARIESLFKISIISPVSATQLNRPPIKRLTIVSCAWGDEYIELFDTVALPAMKNAVNFLGQQISVELLLLTDREFPIPADCKFGVSVEFIPEEVRKCGIFSVLKKYVTWDLAHDESDEAIMWWPPDLYYSESLLQDSILWLESGVSMVAMPHLRIPRAVFHEALNRSPLGMLPSHLTQSAHNWLISRIKSLRSRTDLAFGMGGITFRLDSYENITFRHTNPSPIMIRKNRYTSNILKRFITPNEFDRGFLFCYAQHHEVVVLTVSNNCFGFEVNINKDVCTFLSPAYSAKKVHNIASFFRMTIHRFPDEKS